MARSIPSSPGHASACARNAARSNRPSAGNASTPFGAPPSRMRTVSARVSTPATPAIPLRPQPGIQMLRRPPVGRLGDVLLHHQAARGDGGGLDVLAVGADIADMREGEGDDLPGVGRIGQRLLIAGHAGVEADLADRRRCRRYARRSRGPRTPRRRASTSAAVAPGGTGRSSRGRRLDRGGSGHRQIGQRQAGGGDHRRPMAGRDGAGLAPFAHRLGADAGQPGGRVGAAQPVDDGCPRSMTWPATYGKYFPNATTSASLAEIFSGHSQPRHFAY